MLNEVKQLGLEKFAGDEELADQFVAGFVAHVMLEKEAQDIQLQKEAAQGRRDDKTLFEDLSQNVAQSIGKGIGGLMVNGGVSAMAIGTRYVGDQFRYQRFKKAFLQALQNSHILQSAPRSKVEAYADTIYKFAPKVAEDPNLLQSVLTNAVHGDGVDIMTIKSLTDLENNYRKSGEINPKTFV